MSRGRLVGCWEGHEEARTWSRSLHESVSLAAAALVHASSGDGPSPSDVERVFSQLSFARDCQSWAV